MGEFSKTLSGLEANTTYHYRAFAVNSQGTATGNVISFKTSEEGGDEIGTFTDSRDNKKYKAVKIGDQWWMAENLAYLPAINPPSQCSNKYSCYYVYGFDGTDVTAAKQHPNYTKYGVLYNWPAAMAEELSSSNNPSGVRGICPSGWHLPSDEEWEQLALYISDKTGFNGKTDDDWQEIGSLLKANNGWNENGNGTDDFGFEAFPAGKLIYAYTGFFRFGETSCSWWSSTERVSFYSWYRELQSNNSGFYRKHYMNENGLSMRCVKD